MALWTISDLHLSGYKPKPMDVFGAGWQNHTERLRENWLRSVGEGDTVILPGDFSWGMNLSEVEPDFRWLGELPGRKILLKGNHDYYWTSGAKMQRTVEAAGAGNITFLNGASVCAEGLWICGTKGWFPEVDDPDRKLLNREVIRLRLSLASAPAEAKKLVFLHYPPIYMGYNVTEIRQVLAEFRVKRCFYGHIHGPGLQTVYEGTADGVTYKCVSADYLRFQPSRIE